MSKIVTRSLTLASAALALGLSAGCVTSSDLEEVRKLAQEAKDSAARASSTAEQANQAASAAQQTAQDAQRAAQQAQQTAQEANACCAQMSEKLDRAFKKAVRK